MLPLRNPLLRLSLLLLTSLLLMLSFAALIWYDNALHRGITFRPADTAPIGNGAGPQLGVNLYNIHLEPDRNAVTRSLELARDLGARYVRMQVPWEDIEIHARGDFTDRRNVEAIGVISSWAKYDRLVAEARRFDLELIMRLDRPPAWAREQFIANPYFQEGLKEDGNSTGPPDNNEDYANFVRAIVSRYRDQVRYFQIWNEPNLANEWNWQTPQPEDFVALLRLGYTAVKEANPEAVVLFPSLAPTDGLDKRAPMSELEYLERVYQAGGAAYFDIMSAQAYGLGQPPDEHRYVYPRRPGDWNWRRPIETRNDVSRIVLLREVMERHGDTTTPVWIGEFGWNSAPETIPPERRSVWGAPVSEEQKGEYLVGQIERARREWPWVGAMNVWMLRFGGYAEPDPADPTPYFALVTRDWQRLPAFDALQSYMAQPAVAGPGAHSWAHPAVEQTEFGWRVRFFGKQITVLGVDGDFHSALDSTATYAGSAMIDGRSAAVFDRVPLGEHTLELHGDVMPSGFLVERDPPAPWFWVGAPLLVLGLLMMSGAATMHALFTTTDRLWPWMARRRAAVRPGSFVEVLLRADTLVLIGMFVGLFVFYRLSERLPPTLVGLAIFSALALWRPDLGLLWVPLTVPLYFMPKAIFDASFGIRDDGLRIPLHEVVLLVVVAATALRWAWQQLGYRIQKSEVRSQKSEGAGQKSGVRSQESEGTGRRGDSAQFTLTPTPLPERERDFGQRQERRAPLLPAWEKGPGDEGRGVHRNWQLYAAATLFLVAGTLGVVVAGDRSTALREWRWLIVEPLLFCGLLLLAFRPRGAEAPPLRLINWWLLGGALVGLVGLLQFVGLNLAPLIGSKVGFSDDQIFVEGVQRVTSVYGHPNNLGLYMGRIWPVAAALGLYGLIQNSGFRIQDSGDKSQDSAKRSRVLSLWFSFYGVCGLLALGGLFVSFSRGAWLGALVAAVVLWAGLSGNGRFGRRLLLPLAIVGALGLLVTVTATLLGIERLNPLGESGGIRLKTWTSALAMLRDNPIFGIGLDQFARLYPDYIDPSLLGTNEVNTAHPHNLVLDIWLRMGLLGLVAFGWLIWRFFRSSLPRVTASPSSARALQIGLIAAMSAAIVHGLVDQFYFWPDIAFTFWLLIYYSSTEREPLAHS